MSVVFISCTKTSLISNMKFNFPTQNSNKFYQNYIRTIITRFIMSTVQLKCQSQGPAVTFYNFTVNDQHPVDHSGQRILDCYNQANNLVCSELIRVKVKVVYIRCKKVSSTGIIITYLYNLVIYSFIDYVEKHIVAKEITFTNTGVI